MKELIEVLSKAIKKSKYNVDTLILVKLVLEQYEPEIYVEENEMREKIENILNKFYE